jgi:hypothetical protein
MTRFAYALGLALVLPACSGAATDDTATSTASATSTSTETSTDTTTSSTTTTSTTTSETLYTGGTFAELQKSCVSTFGQAIGNVGFARFDGTVVAALAPNFQGCTAPNKTHVVVEIQVGKDVYRMVMNVDDDTALGSILTREIDHALVGPAWADGWHTGIALDYLKDLGLHQSDFKQSKTADASNAIASVLEKGAKVSFYATAQGEADSAHLVHRNGYGHDGALVVNVEGTPHWLLFDFQSKNF